MDGLDDERGLRPPSGKPMVVLGVVFLIALGLIAALATVAP